MLNPTIPTTQALPAVAPAFDHQLPGEPWQVYSRRALGYLLAHGTAWRLEDGALEAAADGARVAATGCTREQVQLAAVLAQTERDARRLLVVRKADRDRRLGALLAASGVDQGETATQAPEQPQAAPQAPQAGQGSGGGGSRVPRQPRGPRRPGGGGYAQAADESGTGAFRVPAAVAALRPVAPLAASDDLF